MCADYFITIANAKSATPEKLGKDAADQSRIGEQFDIDEIRSEPSCNPEQHEDRLQLAIIVTVEDLALRRARQALMELADPATIGRAKAGVGKEE
jgi:hypothetical protein